MAREALSARIDGEREPVPAARLDEHLGGCEPCRQWYAAAVEQTQALRRLAGRSQVSAVPAPVRRRRRSTRLAALLPAASWQRWALGAVGLTQLGLALAQGLGARHVPTAGHLINESTAWSAALGLVMLAAALRPVAATGLAWVLAAFAAILGGYVIGDAMSGAVTLTHELSHLPVVAGAVLAFLVSRQRPPADPSSGAVADAGGIVLPDQAVRGRRRGHLHPTDGSAA